MKQMLESQKHLDNLIPEQLMSFACELLDGCLNEQQLKERALKLGLLNLPNIALSIFMNPLQDDMSSSEMNKLVDETVALTRRIFKYWEGALIINYRGNVVVLLPRSYRDLELMKSEIQVNMNQLIQAVCYKSDAKHTLIVGVGQYYDHPSMIHLSYSEAGCAAQSYFLQGNRVIFFDDLDENRDLSDSLYLYDAEKKLLEKVGLGDTVAAQEKLAEMVKAFGNLSSEDFLSNLFVFLFEQLVILSRGVLSEGADPKDVADIKRELTKDLIKINDISAMEAWIEKLIKGLIHTIREKVITPSAWLVHEAERYIDNHYEQQISLDEVAKRVHVSPAYLSRIFKEERGESFVKYLNRIRMREAKQLLSKTQLDIGDIAIRVGFRNQNYFTTVFRKREGLTPTDYRYKVQG